MKTLKQIYREHGFEVNRDNQKGIGNKAIEEQLKVFQDFLRQEQQEINENIDAAQFFVPYKEAVNEYTDDLLAKLQSNSGKETGDKNNGEP
jgi:hypothetical protein